MRIILGLVAVMAIAFGVLTQIGNHNAMNETTSAVSMMGGFLLLGLVMVTQTIGDTADRIIAALRDQAPIPAPTRQPEPTRSGVTEALSGSRKR